MNFVRFNADYSFNGTWVKDPLDEIQEVWIIVWVLPLAWGLQGSHLVSLNFTFLILKPRFTTYPTYL